MKIVRAAAVAATLAVVSAQCTTTVQGTGTGDAGLVCGPADVTNLAVAAMHTPRAPHAGKCTTQQIDDYAQCQGAKATALCPQFAPGGASADCGACIESQHGDPVWGVIVFDKSTATFNVEGCVDDALGDVALQGTEEGSCGDFLHDAYGCQEAACSACGGTPIDTCPPVPEAAPADDAGDASDAEDASDAAVCVPSDFARCAALTLASATDASAAGECQSRDAKVVDPAGPCAPLFGASPPPDVASCFPDSSLADAGAAQQVDWLERIVAYMCGP